MAALIFPLMIIILLSAPVTTAVRFTNPESDWEVTPGEILHLSWVDRDQWVDIDLLQGDQPGVMTQADYVAARIEALGFDWTVPYWLEEVFLVPNNLTKVVYALSITDAGENTNYSPVLKLKSNRTTSSNGTTETPPVDSPNTTAPAQLTTAGKAGIGVGAGAVALGILGLVSYIFYHRGKKVEASRNGWTKDSNGSLSGSKGEDLESGGGGGGRGAAKSKTPEELHADEKPIPELDTVESPVELGAATAWELSTGEKCVEEMDLEYREEKSGHGRVASLGSIVEAIRATNTTTGSAQVREGRKQIPQAVN